MVLGLKPMGKLDTPRKSKYQTWPKNTLDTSDNALSSLEVCVDADSTSHGHDKLEFWDVIPNISYA